MNQVPSENEFTGETKAVLDEIKNAFGIVPNFFKAQAAVDPAWLKLNWEREKQIMLSESTLDRKTKELIAFAVSTVNDCEYCSLAHEAMARSAGATAENLDEVRKVVELFESFNSIANSLRIPCDVKPPRSR